MDTSERGLKFVVLSSQRSGTTWLISLLNQLEGTRVYGELFLKQRNAEPAEHWEDHMNFPHFHEMYPKGRIFRPFLVFSYLDKLYRQPGAVGFKLMYTQLQKYPEIFLYLFIHRIKIIHLVRQNQLDVLISRAVKNKINQAHVVSGKNVPEDVQVEINPQKLLRRIKRRYRKILAARRLVSLSTLPHIEVYYEDLLGGSKTFQQICQFLKLEMGDRLPESRLVKIGVKDQAEVVSNYNEIKKALKGTLFAGWVDHSDEPNGTH